MNEPWNYLICDGQKQKMEEAEGSGEKQETLRMLSATSLDLTWIEGEIILQIFKCGSGLCS